MLRRAGYAAFATPEQLPRHLNPCRPCGSQGEADHVDDLVAVCIGRHQAAVDKEMAGLKWAPEMKRKEYTMEAVMKPTAREERGPTAVEARGTGRVTRKVPMNSVMSSETRGPKGICF